MLRVARRCGPQACASLRSRWAIGELVGVGEGLALSVDASFAETGAMARLTHAIVDPDVTRPAPSARELLPAGPTPRSRGLATPTKRSSREARAPLLTMAGAGG